MITLYYDFLTKRYICLIKMEPLFPEWSLDEDEIVEIGYCYYVVVELFPHMIFYYCGELEALNYWPSTNGSNRVKNDKFGLKSYGAWNFDLYQVEKSKFSSREQYDEVCNFVAKDRLSNSIPVDKITIRDAFANMLVSPIENGSTTNEIFNQDMIDILGGECSDDETDPVTGAKTCMLRNYKLAGHHTYCTATAERGDFYLLMFFSV